MLIRSIHILGLILIIGLCNNSLCAQHVNFDVLDISAYQSTQESFTFTSFAKPIITGAKISSQGDQMVIDSIGLNTYFLTLYASINSFRHGWDSEFIYYPNESSDVFTIRKIKAKTFASELNAFGSFRRLQTNEQVHIDILNDVFTSAGGKYISGVISSTHCSIEIIDDQLILFTPKNDFEGIAQFEVLVCDAAETCDEVRIEVLLADYSSIGEVDTIDVILVNDEEGTIPLPLYNFEIVENADFLQASLANFEIKVKGINNQSLIDYVTVESEQLRLTLRIIQLSVPKSNELVSSDIIEISSDATTTFFNVLNNDYSIELNISSFTHPSSGVLVDLGNGNFKYHRELGALVSTSFSYEVCANGICESAIVLLQDKMNRSFQDSYKFSTTTDVPVRPGIFLQDYEEGTTILVIDAANKGFARVESGTFVNGCHNFELQGNELIYRPFLTGTDDFKVEICQPSLGCDTVSFQIDISNSVSGDCGCVEFCVWPGDMDADGQVNMSDLMRLGRHVGESGPERDELTSVWKSQDSYSWQELGTFNYEGSHLDANGDGIVSELDASSISDNYGKTHRISKNQYHFDNSSPFDLINEQGLLEVGDLVVMDISLGNIEFPVHDISGATFEIDFNSDLVDDESVFLNFNENSWLVDRDPQLNLTIRENKGKIEAGVTRLGNQASSGYGIVAHMGFIIVDDIEGFKLVEDAVIPIQVNLTNGRAMSISGDEILLPDAAITINLNRLASKSVIIREDQLLTYPNPTIDQMTIHLNGHHEMLSYNVYNSNGQLVRSGDMIGNHSELNLDGLETGLHFIEVQTTNGAIAKKIQIVR